MEDFGKSRKRDNLFYYILSALQELLKSTNCALKMNVKFFIDTKTYIYILIKHYLHMICCREDLSCRDLQYKTKNLLFLSQLSSRNHWSSSKSKAQENIYRSCIIYRYRISRPYFLSLCGKFL